jgi:hypothetical protein
VYIIIDCLFVSFSLSCPSLLEVILEVWKYFGKWDVPMNQTFYLEYSSFHHLKKKPPAQVSRSGRHTSQVPHTVFC